MFIQMHPSVAAKNTVIHPPPTATALVATDQAGRIFHYNSAFLELTGLPDSAVAGVLLHHVLTKFCDDDSANDTLSSLYRDNETATLLTTTIDNIPLQLRISCSCCQHTNGEIQHFFIIEEVDRSAQVAPNSGSDSTADDAFDANHKRKLSEATASLIETNVELRRKIRERQQAIEALRESENRFRDLTETTSDFIWEINRDGIYTYASPKSHKLLGHRPDELLGKQFLLFQDPRNVSEFINCVELPGTHSSGFSGLVYRFKREDGRQLVIESSGEPIFSKQGEIIGFRGIDRDITERVHYEEKLKLAKRIAEQANHAKSEFLANMSHELRTPLHAILSFSNHGTKKINKGPREDLLKYFQQIASSAERLLPLIDDLLDLSKLEAGKMVYSFQRSDIRKEIHLIIDEMTHLLHKRGISIHLHTAPFDPIAIFDSERIGQVLRNILSNAYKFSHDGSDINIHFQQRTMSSGKNYLQTTIANDGIGIPKDELDAIFDKFAQSSKTKTGAGGTGLGLSICKEILRDHRGNIWAENSNTGETLFHFTLPTAPQTEKIGQILLKKGLVTERDLEEALKDQ